MEVVTLNMIIMDELVEFEKQLVEIQDFMKNY